MINLDTSSFQSASRAVLSFLHRQLGFDLWMVTRVAGSDWIVLQTEGRHPEIAPSKVYRWSDSFCSEMAKGNGPRVAPRSDLVPAYANSPIGRELQVKAYIGSPLFGTDGRLFGTLCAIHPAPRPESIVQAQSMVDLFGQLLSTILQLELKATDAARQTERLTIEALTDTLTKTYNRRGWDRLLSSEEERCSRFGHPAAVLVIDLNGLKRINDTQGHASGDALIMRAAASLRRATRATDIVARLGGDEFGILAVECDRDCSDILLQRIRAVLVEDNVSASVGLSMRTPSQGLAHAWSEADQRMYAEKRSQRNADAAEAHA
ncbi:sensor domain-containing diguanylate cyclase [Noviherbaspirillum aerium]|uniref:sensor domain-containing diguanylate cyclase n=1 Tax=Noviherbaspirillum aerium TaxID=2588497 RepID=UPI00124C8BC1|nr:sensor domain-containing diguanylate cyclase [Noviherbaspirillum aerium]